MLKKIFLSLLLLFTTVDSFAQKTVNVYVWGGEIPKALIHTFEKESGIKVNFSTYDSNETLYAKLKASQSALYDVIIPSSYYVERMKNQGMLMPLDHTKIPNLSNLDPFFENNVYDPKNQFSVPLVWGATGIFLNKAYIKNEIYQLKDLWSREYRDKILLLDDAREIFSIALLSLGYSPNDSDANHIYKAFKALIKFSPNIRLFSSDGVQATIIDEDALLGIVWNGDAYKAQQENKNIQFIYPKEGFVLWVDCLAIPIGAPHTEEAYALINFLLKPQSGVTIALREGHAITNKAAIKRLPKAVIENKMVYPERAILNRAHFQRDVSDATLNLYNQYWQAFKLSL